MDYKIDVIASVLNQMILLEISHAKRNSDLGRLARLELMRDELSEVKEVGKEE